MGNCGLSVSLAKSRSLFLRLYFAAHASACATASPGWHMLVGSPPHGSEPIRIFAALGESLGDDLSVERVGKDLGPFFERAIGGDGRGAAVVVAFADDLKGELGLVGSISRQTKSSMARRSALTYLRRTRSRRPCSSAPCNSLSIFGAEVKTTRFVARHAR